MRTIRNLQASVSLSFGSIEATDGAFRVMLAPINEPSDDHRVIVDDLGWREPPLPFMASDSEEGHGDAVHVGNLDNFARETVDEVDWIVADLTYLPDENSQRYAEKARAGTFNGVSIHMGRVDFAPVKLDGETWRKLTKEELDALWEPDAIEEAAEDYVDPWTDIYDGAFDAEIAAATQVAIPAFADSQILQASVSGAIDLPLADREMEWDAAAAQASMFGDGEEPDFATARKGHLFVDGDGELKGDYKLPFAEKIDGTLTAVPRGIFATAGAHGVDATDIPDDDKAAIRTRICTYYDRINAETDGDEVACPFAEAQLVASLERPPHVWFVDPELTGATPLTVDDDGRVFGHLALWDTCHTGFSGECVQAPRDPDFSLFESCRVIADDGVRVPVGPLVVDDGHAPTTWSVPKTMRYYADTRLAAAYVTAGVDEYGIWVAGAVAHDATDSQRETLRRHPLSGDWRKIDGAYKLVAAVAVNAPGFAVPEVLVATVDGAEAAVGLVTYGPEPDGPTDLALVASSFELLAAKIDQVLDGLAEAQARALVDSEADAVLADMR